MKKLLSNSIKYTPVLLATVLIGLFSMHIAHADTGASGIDKIFNLNFFDFMSQSIAQFFFQLQTIASWLIVLAGYLLNFSINLTLHIKEFVDQTPAIFTTWKALRDITGMLIIFFLLYFAIQLITGLKGQKFGELIKNIVLAGVLINFSFFFAGLGIDASNMVSVQLYNAIAPKSSLNPNNLSVNGIGNTAADGGLSDIFMASMKIPALYDVTGQRTTAGEATGGGTWTQPVQMMLIGVTSIMIMITAAFSFGLAAIMFIVRFVLLLFLLAFSPLWFMSFISPELKSYTGKFTDYYKNMLLIMPVYLLLMYMSLNVLTSQNFFGNPGYGNATTVATPADSSRSLIDQALAAGTPSGSAKNWYGGILSLAVNAVIVIFMMNIPLIGAISIGGGAVKFLNAEKMGAGTLWKKFGGYARTTGNAGAIASATAGFVGTNTIGRAGSYLDKKFENTKIGNSILGRDLRAKTTGALAAAKMGASRSYVDRTKLQRDVDRRDREIDRMNVINNTNSSDAEIKATMSKMSEKEKLAIGKEKLTDLKFAKHLKGSDYEAIKKSDDYSDEEKNEIATARKTALNDAIAHNEKDVVKHMVENMDGKDLLKLDDSVLRKQEVIEHLRPSQLKTMAEENLEDGTKRYIGNTIKYGTWTQPHKSRGFIDTNDVNWL